MTRNARGLGRCQFDEVALMRANERLGLPGFQFGVTPARYNRARMHKIMDTLIARGLVRRLHLGWSQDPVHSLTEAGQRMLEHGA